MSPAKRNDVPTKVPKLGLWFRQLIEPVRKLAIKSLLCDVAPFVERIERVCETVVENQPPNAGFVPAEDRLAVHFPESLAFVSKIQDTVVKKFRSALRMLLAEFRESAAEFVTDLCHRFPPTSDSVEVDV